jgi:hypothetical protein
MPSLQEKFQCILGRPCNMGREVQAFGFLVTIGGPFTPSRMTGNSGGSLVFHYSCRHLDGGLAAGDVLSQDELAGFDTDFREVEEK